MLAAGSPVHVRKLKPSGALDYAWQGTVLRCDASGIVLRAEFNVDLVERDWATFRRGDVFVEFYYFDPRSSGSGKSSEPGLVGNRARGSSDPGNPDSPARVRYYNVFQISSSDGTLKGWYCNLGLPAQLDPESGVLSYVDLALDVWANPDGTFVVLDEDELEAILEQHPELTDAARQGRADLINLARSGRFPRWPS
jgi:protein associated with RNAse G/E